MKFLILGCLLSTLASASVRQTVISQPFHNEGVVERHPEAYSRIVAISDVHGMYFNLLRLLHAVHLIERNQKRNGEIEWIGGNTLLIVVGDSIDKGPDSVNVLDLWMNLADQAHHRGGEVLHILGNHEAEFLADPTNPKAEVLIAELHRKAIPVQQLISPAFKRGAYLRSMPLAARVGNWLFCHAGLYPAMLWQTFKWQAQRILTLGLYGNPFITGPESVLEAKDWWKDPRQRANLEGILTTNHFYGVVFGHQPDAFNVKNDIAAVDRLRLIKIDSGMGPSKPGQKDGSNPGHLLVFLNPSELNAMAPPETYSMAIDGTKRPLIP